MLSRKMKFLGPSVNLRSLPPQNPRPKSRFTFSAIIIEYPAERPAPRASPLMSSELSKPTC